MNILNYIFHQLNFVLIKYWNIYGWNSINIYILYILLFLFFCKNTKKYHKQNIAFIPNSSVCHSNIYVDRRLCDHLLLKAEVYCKWWTKGKVRILMSSKRDLVTSLAEIYICTVGVYGPCFSLPPSMKKALPILPNVTSWHRAIFTQWREFSDKALTQTAGWRPLSVLWCPFVNNILNKLWFFQMTENVYRSGFKPMTFT